MQLAINQNSAENKFKLERTKFWKFSFVNSTMSYAWNPIMNSIYMSTRTTKFYTRAGNTSNQTRNEVITPYKCGLEKIIFLLRHLSQMLL
jgi:hypothetical protein